VHAALLEVGGQLPEPTQVVPGRPAVAIITVIIIRSSVMVIMLVSVRS
jgi:hypothetical protein